jgi:UDP-glucose 4-epimerase
MNQGIIVTFLKLIRKGLPLPVWGDGMITRDYLYVNDAIEAIVKGLNYRGPYKIFNVG